MTIRTHLASLVLASISLGLLGCQDEAKPLPVSDKPAIKPGPAYEPGPIQPSPIPQMPPTGKNSAPDGKMDKPM